MSDGITIDSPRRGRRLGAAALRRASVSIFSAQIALVGGDVRAAKNRRVDDQFRKIQSIAGIVKLEDHVIPRDNFLDDGSAAVRASPDAKRNGARRTVVGDIPLIELTGVERRRPREYIRNEGDFCLLVPRIRPEREGRRAGASDDFIGGRPGFREFGKYGYLTGPVYFARERHLPGIADCRKAVHFVWNIGRGAGHCRGIVLISRLIRPRSNTITA
jgi:hypothetical protein